MLSISSFLFSGYRQKVLALLLLHPETRYHVREIARITNTTAGSLHRELTKLAEVQVLIREVSGNQVYYKANKTFPIFDELVSILRKTSGLADILKHALIPFTEKIKVAFVFGSLGRGTENEGSDVDVLIIGRLSFAEAVAALYPAQSILNREVNPKVYLEAEWQKLVSSQNAFVQEILHKPKIFIVGTLNDLK